MYRATRKTKCTEDLDGRTVKNYKLIWTWSKLGQTQDQNSNRAGGGKVHCSAVTARTSARLHLDSTQLGSNSGGLGASSNVSPP